MHERWYGLAAIRTTSDPRPRARHSHTGGDARHAGSQHDARPAHADLTVQAQHRPAPYRMERFL